MADDSKQTGSGLGNAFLWLALITAGSTFFLSREAPFKDSRPPPVVTTAEEQLYGRQNIPARLWQDPFSTVEKSRQQESKVVLELSLPTAIASGREKIVIEGYRGSARCEGEMLDGCSLSQVLPKAMPDRPLVLGVMVSGASYSEGAEFRRRIRYAVLAALNVEGYAPDDTEHIGAALMHRDAYPGVSLPPFIPFEWLSWNGSAEGDIPRPPNRLLILWLNEDTLSIAPMPALVCIAHHVNEAGATFKILGPEYSYTLKAIVDALRSKPEVGANASCNTTSPVMVRVSRDDASGHQPLADHDDSSRQHRHLRMAHRERREAQ